MKKKKIIRWFKILLLIYCGVGIGIYFLQQSLFFHPVAVPRDQPYSFATAFREVNIPYTDQSNINIVQFTPDSSRPVRGIVLYFHGNRRNVGWYARFAPQFTRHGYEVWMMDYPGYGKSTGELTEAMLYDWSLQVYKLARARIAADSIIIYGKSMGTGVAAQLASIRNCRALVLESPYYSLPSLVSSYAPVYPVHSMIHIKLPTWKYLQQVTAPVTIFEGGSDWVVPYRNSKKLKPFLKPQDHFYRVEGAGHNNLGDFDIFRKGLDSVLEK